MVTPHCFLFVICKTAMLPSSSRTCNLMDVSCHLYLISVCYRGLFTRPLWGMMLTPREEASAMKTDDTMDVNEHEELRNT